MQKLEKLLLVKKNSKSVKIVCEHYLRNDIPCKSGFCNSCEKWPGQVLPTNCTHYLVPDCEVTQVYFEILELKALTGILLMQTVSNFINQIGNKKQYEKLKSLFKDPDKGCILFNNEHHGGCYIKRSLKTNIDTWRMLNIYYASKWYHNHLNGAVPIIILTENQQFLKTHGSETQGVFIMTTEDYLKGFWPDLSEAHDLYDSLTSLVGVETNVGIAICKEYRDYYPKHILQAGIKSGRFVSSYMRVNKHNPIQEAFVSLAESNEISLKNDILIPGTAFRNRAIDGDLVVVEILPKEKWHSKVSSIASISEDDPMLEKESNTMVTGCVVGILQRNLRDFVVSIAEFSSSFTGGKLLVVPWDVRIPKIRVCTHQVNKLKDKRFIVRIDSWDTSSLYPNGHFVKVLGTIGDVEAEIATILVEHNLLVTPFSDRVIKEMPLSTKDDPWKITELEVMNRRDLRESHLVFSIDPKDCEDVDDALSVREQDGEVIELGVHIADVSYFVKPNSFTDLDARSRSTTVYLADRRYDMLPAILSSDLCSLISGVDRYAVSVIWKLDNNYDVVDIWYGRTIIRSKYKLYYEAAQAISENQLQLNDLSNIIPEFKDVHPASIENCYQELQKSVCLLMKVARKLKAKRSSKGAVDLEGGEIQISVSSAKQVNELAPKKSLEVHETIAECMIFANHWVAKKIKDSFKTNSLLRCHPPPNQDFFTPLKDCAKAAGFQLDTTSNQSLASSLDVCGVSDPHVNKVFRLLATQAMNVASYFSTGSFDAEKYYHYGLALDAYTHFTSPIRRYADVLVHRLLLASVNSSYDQNLLGNSDLQSICDHMNIKHRQADRAQKASVQFFLSQYFKSNQSDDRICRADALVYNLRSNGVLVFVPRYGVKGVVFLKNKFGEVACEDDALGCIVYKHGSLTKFDDRITIRCNDASRDVFLFTYLKVRISVNSSKVHLETLNYELLSFSSDIKFDKDIAKVERSDIVKDVKDVEAVKNESISLQKADADDHLKKLYQQTHKSVSLYEMFRRFKQTALYDKSSDPQFMFEKTTPC